MEWFIILSILIVILVALKSLSQTQDMYNKNTSKKDRYKETRDLVMLPVPYPAPLTTHITL